MHEINASTAAVTASFSQQNSATEEISHNVASAADGTSRVVAVLGAATETRSSAETCATLRNPPKRWSATCGSRWKTS